MGCEGVASVDTESPRGICFLGSLASAAFVLALFFAGGGFDKSGAGFRSSKSDTSVEYTDSQSASTEDFLRLGGGGCVLLGENL